MTKSIIKIRKKNIKLINEKNNFDNFPSFFFSMGNKYLKIIETSESQNRFTHLVGTSKIMTQGP